MTDETAPPAVTDEVERLRRAQRLEQLEAALGTIYRRFGFEHGPTLELCDSPQALMNPPMSYALRIGAAIVFSALQLAERRGGAPPIHDLDGFGSTTGTAFQSLDVSAWPVGWRGPQGRATVEQLIMGELGFWRQDVLATARLEPASTSWRADEDTEEAIAMRALGLLRSEGLLATLGPARARLVPHPQVWRSPAGEIHREGGPAVLWPGGFGFYVLNGVRVPDWLAMTPAEALEATQLEHVSNMEQRREFVRKIGVERLCRELGATVLDRVSYPVAHRRHRSDVECESQDAACGVEAHWTTRTITVTYELLNLDLKDGRRRPYLKMENPSVPGLYHLEGVPPEVRTAQEAINWRAHGNVRTHWKPEVLT